MSLPACFTVGDPRSLPPRGDDFTKDRAASCRAYGPDMDPPTEFPAACDGCARKLRADLIRTGDLSPHPHRTGPAPREAV